DCGNLMVAEGVVAVAVGEAGVAESVAAPLSESGIPTMFFGAGSTSILEDDTSFAIGDPTVATIRMPIGLAEDLGVTKVTTVVIDVPAAIETQEIAAPPLYEAAGIDYDFVAVPPGTADMTPQMQSVVDGDPGVVFVIGNDSFCISAFNGLAAVGYEGTISAISQCITDATRDAVSADVLDGMVVAASVPVGAGDPTGVLYETVINTFGEGVDASSPTGRGMYMTLGALASALSDIEGEITPETATAAIKAAPEQELPGAAGLQFRCNGNAYPESPAACVRGGLSTTLDADGLPSTFEVLGTSPIED
nr:ABC transporter substrate-binding protein [Micromonospora sp. DSM 115978]